MQIHINKVRDDKLAVNILFFYRHVSKLKAYGFQERPIQLLNSYLCDRYNRVQMGKKSVRIG